ncbi:nitroreductase [Candidatus Pacearchaeota archaeon CG10_big_fil_rev_8_21_14_0_10_32_14]|nr:MAG: nitroreductase [Candidatus Pacearchaeota archaeon CG10_big_fil_rev_8_21_14_0_10_32_14]
MDLTQVIKSRHSVRKFSSKTPDWRDIIQCIDLMRYSPMAGNIFSLKFIMVDDQKKINELSKASEQEHVNEAQYVLVVCSEKKLTLNAHPERGETYCKQQAGAAIQNFLLKITEIGLSSCWVGLFDEIEVKRTLNIPPEVEVEAILPIGFERGIPKVRRKPILDSCLYFNSYRNKFMKKQKRVN